MSYGLLADFVLVAHAGFVLFAAFGGLLALRWRGVVWVHLPAVAWGGYVEVAGRVCPLTPLENRLRAAAGEAGYEGGFVEHYLLPVLYPGALTPAVQLALGLTVILINAGIYAAVLRRHARGE